MDFARKQLEKYGWSEGKGLGKQEDGIRSAIKPRLKFDNTGVGHDAGADFTNNWWENVYNNASKNVKIKEKDGNIEMQLASDESVEITTKNYSVRDFKTKNKKMEYGTFLKTSKLTEDGVVNYDNVVAPEETTGMFKVAALTDEELFAACGGRTAHKGARHGLKLSGKLSRIDKQEKLLLKKLQNVSITDDDNLKTEKKLKKLNKNKEKVEVLEGGIKTALKKKKKKKKRKSVSFNETVTEYHTQDLDTSSQSNESEPPVVLTSKIKDKDRTDDLTTPDEGIEQDCDMKPGSLDQECFKRAQPSMKDVKTRDRATDRFLRNVFAVEKRKYEEDPAAASCACSSKKKCECDDVIVISFKTKKKKNKKDEHALNNMIASLDQVCKISDSGKKVCKSISD